jgi:uncharacterized protein involved in tellurium resistance
MILTQTYEVETIRTLTVVPYIYDAAAETAVIFTETEGAIVISAADTPEIWTQFMAQK